MTDPLGDLFTPTTAATLNGNATPRRRRCAHEWRFEDGEDGPVCARCGIAKDSPLIRRGRAARRLGADQERRIQSRYGPRKVGQFGDAVDHVGRVWKWQSKATRGLPPLWLTGIDKPTKRFVLPTSITTPLGRMLPLYQALQPVVIRSYVHVGLPTRDWLFIFAEDYGDKTGGYIVMSGDAWLDLYGRDAPGVPREGER